MNPHPLALALNAIGRHTPLMPIVNLSWHVFWQATRSYR